MQYQLVHAVALFAIAIWMRLGEAGCRFAAWSWVIGILLFSGSLYAYVLTYTLAGVRFFALITPLGGVFFILGWLLVILAAWKLPTSLSDVKQSDSKSR